MYPKFIEVHELNDIRYADTHLVSVNVDNITFFGDKTIFVPIPDDNGYYTINVTESYDEIKQLIHDAGVLIHKADPRLDTTTPLTMEDLKDMVGEPVWNSNIDVWMLVKDVSDTWVKMLWTSGNVSEYTEDELIAYPVYRMRRA